ncbi:MAG: hypothetical protein NC102_02930 [Clostridium sp.]|nr:hypothetical protein [Clostridium sp.]
MVKHILPLILAILSLASAYAQAPTVYVLDLNDEVDAKMWMQTRRALDTAKDLDASLLVVHINTYGGAVDAADSIRTALLRTPIPTVAFVDTNAASAGSLITLACDSVYMAPGGSYGASSVVNQSGEIMPDKYQSYMKSIMRATAESHGKIWNPEDSAWQWRRDPAIAQGFVNPDSVITLTPEEAIAVGYAEGKASSVNEVIRHHIDGEYRVERFESTATDHIIGFLASAAVRAVLIMLILGGIYFEMHTPGLGFAGGVAFVAAILYFLPTIITGTMAPWVVIVFILGIVLLALELFVIPGFGLCGVAGILAILAAIMGGMLNTDSINGVYAVDFTKALTISSIGIILTVILAWYLTSKHGPRWARRVATLETDLKVSEGYIGVDQAISKFVGKEGEAITDLRPAGKIMIDGQEFDAVSLSGYIEAHTKIKAERFENAQLYVRK